MKLLYTFILCLIALTGYSQKIPSAYKLEIFYIDNTSEIRWVKNEKMQPNQPKPYVKSQSVFYAGKNHFSNVKKIIIMSIEYDAKPSSSDISIRRVEYFNPNTGRYEYVNVIRDLAAEREQMRVQSNRPSIFAPQSDSDTLNAPLHSHEDEAASIEKIESVEDKVVEIKQNIYTLSEDDKLNRLENTGIVFKDNTVTTKFNDRYTKVKIKESSDEYTKFKKLNLKAGTYMIIEGYSIEGTIIQRQILPIKIKQEDW